MANQDTNIRDVFMVGLRNAHALENEALSIMNRQIERMTDYPDLLARLRQHVGETNRQIQRIEQILGSHDESHSSLKDTALSIAGNIAAMMHAPAEDEILKNTFADLAFEAYEIAAYKSLIAMARACGETQAIPLLEESLKEEEAMAAFLDQNVDKVTVQYLSQRRA
ncbi:ferritin-like domain-containing protein [Chthonobacter albigriseus]|uniref:ferritin-like domain-containing protein n=1 Tax=Chthonobacter albigriseus TaxID=1683161 RepID=UPI0015EEE561|nr:ferritin-like domain-containing protein [Chthonobacter albigriseus]